MNPNSNLILYRWKHSISWKLKVMRVTHRSLHLARSFTTIPLALQWIYFAFTSALNAMWVSLLWLPWVLISPQLPYYGGKRNCEAGQDGLIVFNPEELVCGGCSGSASCDKHGKAHMYVDFQQIHSCFDCCGVLFIRAQCSVVYLLTFYCSHYKCRFCCSLASWFCFGLVHYCEKCHSEPYKYAIT